MQLHFKTYGSGEPVIILHGMLGMLDNWMTVAKKLSKHHLVFLVDQRNHGRSPHESTMSYPEMSEDLYEFMNDQWLYEGASIIGHSMGGKTAMQFALDYPEWVKKLVVIDIAPVQYPPSHQHIFDALRALDLTAIPSRSAAESQLVQTIQDIAQVRFLLKNLVRKEGHFQWRMNLQGIISSYQELLAPPQRREEPFAGPVQFYRGSRSNYIEHAHKVQIQSMFPEATITEVPKAGHWIHADNLPFLMEMVQEFLKK